MIDSLYNYILIPWVILGLLTFIVLLKVKAPYGKFVNQGWGPSISFKWGWILQEIISPISFSFFFLWTIQEKGFVVWIFFLIWNLHYINRSIIFPLRKREHENTPKCPIVIIISAIFFNLINGFINGYFLGKIAQYNFDYIFSFNFIFGFLILIIGIIINIKSDNILIKIKKRYSNYQIPNGFMYKYIACPNYFGEIIEWIGFYLMTLSSPALIFVFWTMCNLIPRAISTHDWYVSNFKDYPKNRKAIIPFLI